ISMAHLGPDNVAQRFKGMVRRCADCGFDLAGGKVEVVPTAHYHMGGVMVDTDTRTALEGLYVAGEDAGGAHGANRLGGNGVANSTVYGGIAGEVMGRDIAGFTLREPDEAVLEAELARATRPLGPRPGLVQPLRQSLQDLMWEDVGVIRTEEGMSRALDRLDALRDELAQVGVAADTLAFNLTWHDWLNLASLIEVSEVIARAGLSRENSRGAHYRDDHPEVGDLDASYFTLARRDGERVTCDRAPVAFTIVKPGGTILPEGEPETLVAAE
ncbi:MAG: FAD-binding protein, partial [Pseudomonadota bacterium]